MTEQPTIDPIWDAGHLRSESISARLDGEFLPGDVRAAVDAHLESCDTCHRRSLDFGVVRDRLNQFPLPPPSVLDLLTTRALEKMTMVSAAPATPADSPLATITDMARHRTERTKRFMAVAAVAAVAVIGIGVGSVMRANRPISPSDQLAQGDTTPQLRIGEPATTNPTGADASQAALAAAQSATDSGAPASPVAPAPSATPPPLSATDLAAKQAAELPTGVPPTNATQPITSPNTKQLDALPPPGPPPGDAASGSAASKAPAAAASVTTATLPTLNATSPEALSLLLTANPSLVDTLALSGPCLVELTTALGSTEVRLGAAQINAQVAIIGVTRSVGKKAVTLRIAQADPTSCIVTEIGVAGTKPRTTNAK